MEFIIQKENIYNSLKIVEKATALRGVQPVLSNVLVETLDNETVKFAATDLDLAIEIKATATVSAQGAVTLPAKKLNEIISKLPDKPITFSLNTENNLTVITCGNSKFDLMGIAATEFPNVSENSFIEGDSDFVNIEIQPLLKAIKQTVFASATYDSNNILSGIYCKIGGQQLEMAATDGNRLARVIEKITNEEDKAHEVVIPSKTLSEFTRFVSGVSEDKVSIVVKNGQIAFKLSDRFMTSRLIEGKYPRYQQLIPEQSAKIAKINREDLINALDRTATMVNERTSSIKFTFDDNKLLLNAETSDFGDSMDVIDVEYDSEELVIAFNYKYIIDALRIMDSEKVKVEMNSSLSATIFKPDSEDDYLCLIMPVNIR